MADGGGARLILTVLFALLGAWYLAGVAGVLPGPGAGRGRRALGSALHVAMSVAMIGMLWPWGTGIPAIAQVTLFTAAAGWFGGQALFGAGGHHGDGTYANWYHAGMMAVMAWVAVLAQLPVPPAGDATTAASDMSGMAMSGDMPAMAMGGPAAGGTVATSPAMAALPGWAGTACVVLAVALFAVAALQAVSALRPLTASAQNPAPALSWPDLSGIVAPYGAGALMAAGMAVALLEMT